jgi:predicted translin family RNA/ssDNA-binding protein
MEKQSTNKKAHEQTSQLERANEALTELASNVTTYDRQEAMKEYSEFTIVQYLKGRGKNLDMAMSLLQFFRKRIDGREKFLA